MKIHHLNCGSFCPLTHPIVNRAIPELDRLNLVCHCLLIESEQGLILVDTGLGLEDVRNQERFLPNFIFNKLAKPKLDLEETAFMQIMRLGLNPKDVKHIIVSHFDADHIGGINDFPQATVHVLQEEWQAALNPQDAREKVRYKSLRWKNNNKIKTYESVGEDWNGLCKIQNLAGIDKSIYLIALPGHTRGHTGVFIEHKNDLFFTGDSYLLETQLKSDNYPLPLKLYDKMTHVDLKQAYKTLSQLREINLKNPEIKMFSSHDRELFIKMMEEE